MKEQIEEMVRDLQKSEHWYFNEQSVDFELDRRKTAENLYNAGYRKQKEGEWIERIEKPDWLEAVVDMFARGIYQVLQDNGARLFDLKKGGTE